jgi:hypothetical protein
MILKLFHISYFLHHPVLVNVHEKGIHHGDTEGTEKERKKMRASGGPAGGQTFEKFDKRVFGEKRVS